MLHIIENEFIKIAVDDLGAELKSLVGKRDGFEYLWQGDSRYWAGSSPVLFPYCGRLKDATLISGGNSYPSKTHGFARAQKFKLTEKTPSSLAFTLASSDELLEIFPYKFSLTVTYAIKDDTLYVIFDIKNPDSEKVLDFSVGAHPGFNTNFEVGDSFTDYYIEFPETSDIKRINLVTPFLDDPNDLLEADEIRDGRFIDLDREFFKKNRFYSDMPRIVSLRSRTSKKCVTLRYSDFSYLGLWQPEEDEPPFVCIEPWAGLPDSSLESVDFSEKYAIMHLDPLEKKNLSYSITVM